MKRRVHNALLLFVIALLLIGCPTRSDSGHMGQPTQQVPPPEPAPLASSEPTWQPIRAVQGQQLEQAQIDELLGRLPSLEADEADQVEFLRRVSSMPPPLTGENIEGGWPPDLSDPMPQASPDGPLQVQAFRPDGQVVPPFQVAIAFDRPVVAVGAVGEQPIADVSLSPQVQGRWRWLGTQTLVFEPENRWPNATEFEIEVAAGLEAIDGQRLEEALSFAFATPAPQVDVIYPQHGPHASDVPVMVIFNQPVDRASAEAITVRAGRRVLAMRLLEEAELEEALSISHWWNVSQAIEEGRILALAPVEDYPDGRQITVEVRGPIASREGPVVGMADGQTNFGVRGAFTLEEIRCGYGRSCHPGNPLVLTFSNPIDAESDIEVVADPAVEDISVHVSHHSLVIRGDFQPRTRYSLEVSEGLIDVFEQELRGARIKSIRVDAHPPMMAGPNLSMVVRPASMSQTIPIRVAELSQLRVRVYDVSPEDWGLVLSSRGLQDSGWTMAHASQETLRFSRDERRERREVEIDLSAGFGDRDGGHALVIFDNPSPWPSRSARWMYWVQHSELAADLSTDQRNLNVRVSTLSHGEPVEAAEIFVGERHVTSTSATGEARLEVPRGEERTSPLILRHGDHSLLIPVNGSPRWVGPGHQWTYQEIDDRVQWYVFDDRQLYRPGESVRLRGWVRKVEASPRSAPRRGEQGQTIDYVVTEPRNNEITRGEVTLDEFGGFELEFEIPEGVNLGQAWVRFSRGSEWAWRYNHPYQIEEFRRPEYEVSLSSSAGPHLPGEATQWNGQASYYAGGALVGAPTTWRFQEQEASFAPAGWSGWSFGMWSPWWWSHRHYHHYGYGADFQVVPESNRQVVSGQTTAAGHDGMTTVFEAPERGFPRRVTATLSVTDINRQSWQATESVLVHPSSTYVGLRAEKSFIQRHEAWDVEIMAVDVDGDVVEGAEVVVELRRDRGEAEPLQSCERASAADAVRCSFDGLTPGSYQVTATVEDDQGRTSQTEMTFWVAGQDRTGAQTAEEGQLLLIPEAEQFAVGDVARLLVQAPYYPLDAVVELRRDGLYERRLVTLTAEDPVVEVEIEEEMIPNVGVQVSAVAAGDAYAVDAFASGNIDLKVDPRRRTLDVRISPEAEAISPGATIDVGVEVLDFDGEPVEGAQVVLFAVDESVLGLVSYLLPDPVATFYPLRQPGMGDIRSRSWLLLEADDDEEELAMAVAEQSRGRMERQQVVEESEPMRRGEAMADAAYDFDDSAVDGDLRRPNAARMSGGGGAAPPAPINLREVFDALAFYRSDLITDEEGRAQITATMPESLTRYRIMAVAISGDEFFGKGVEEVTARMPLMVRPSEPRFLNVGDEFDFAVVVQNQTTEPMTVDLALRATATLEWLEAPGRRVEVPAADRIEVRWRARSTTAGRARVQVVGASGVFGDAQLASFPVLTPATTEAFATYGSLSDTDVILEALSVPQNAHSQFGGLDIQTSSTQMQALTDAFLYLVNYQFECSEQLASRILSVLALHDVLEAFDAPDLPDADELDAAINEWITELSQLQHRDGGFKFWSGSRESWPFISVHATLALIKAQQEGYEVNAAVLANAQRYLSNIRGRLNDYDRRSAATVEAYAHYVRHRSASTSRRDLDQLVGHYGMENLSLEALGWLLPSGQGTSWETRFMQRIQNQVQETAATAEFQETYASGAHHILHTTRRTDGVVLDGLMQVDPDHHLTEKVVRGLLAHRSRGRWSNTQENVFILMALRRYFDHFEADEPDFIARAWLGEDQIAEHGFHGRTTERSSIRVPMSHLHQGDAVQPVVLQRDGQGRMYYRVGVRYAPTSRQLPSLNQGFRVERTYHAVDHADDVVAEDDGSWTVKAGARVRVELTMTVPARRYHVALVDWLPAGFEPINAALSVSEVEAGLAGGTADYGSRWGFWSWPWYQHQNMRDERVEAFASLISQGVYTYSYVARATTPGEFIAMPAKAEEMYHPETFGRSATEIVRVVDH